MAENVRAESEFLFQWDSSDLVPILFWSKLLHCRISGVGMDFLSGFKGISGDRGCVDNRFGLCCEGMCLGSESKRCI